MQLSSRLSHQVFAIWWPSAWKAASSIFDIAKKYFGSSPLPLTESNRTLELFRCLFKIKIEN